MNDNLNNNGILVDDAASVSELTASDISSHLYFREYWNAALATGTYPSFLRHIIRIDAEEFVRSIREADAQTAKELVDSILAGDAYVLKNAHREEEVDELRRRIVHWRFYIKYTDSEQILEGRTNYHKLNNTEFVGSNYYQTCEHAHGFFRWNEDTVGIFPLVDPYWEAIKIVSGNAPDAFVENTPEDGVIDKLAVYQYPMTFGRVTKHYDPPTNQKLLLNLPMGKIGRDYGFGEYGFYAIDGDSRKQIFLEHTMNFGDYVCVCPTVHHGAQPVQPVHNNPDTEIDWKSDRGRWLLAALAVPSHHVAERNSTVAVND